MLSIDQMTIGREAYYIDLAAQDYYQLGGEPPGRWVGEGTAALGLGDLVDREEFTELFSGFNKDGQKRKLVQNAGLTEGPRRRVSGWDMTFSAPKSVSTLWSQADRATRAEIQAAQQDAVEKTLSWLQDYGIFTRRGKDGTGLEKSKTRLCHL